MEITQREASLLISVLAELAVRNLPGRSADLCAIGGGVTPREILSGANALKEPHRSEAMALLCQIMDASV